MAITAHMLTQYRSRGWLVVEGVFAPEEADAIAALALQHSDEDDGGAGFLRERSADGSAPPRKVPVPFTRDARFRAFVLDARLAALLEALLGAPPLLATDQIFMKPPRHGSAKPYHQDNAYFRCRPADQVVTAWIALDDVDGDNGCLRYIDGSHRDGILPHGQVAGERHNLTPEPALIDLSREALAPVRKGGVVFHHSEVLHGSHSNTSPRWRRGYATHWVTAAVVSDGPVLDRAHFKRADYPQAVAPRA